MTDTDEPLEAPLDDEPQANGQPEQDQTSGTVDEAEAPREPYSTTVLAILVASTLLTALAVIPAFVSVAERLFMPPPIPPERIRLVVWGLLAGYAGLAATLLFALWHTARALFTLARRRAVNWAVPTIALLPFIIVAVTHDMRDTLSWHLLELAHEMSKR